MKPRRHPFLGGFGGLLFGVGLALMLVLYGKVAFGTNTPYVVVLVCTLLGLAAGLVPERSRAGGPYQPGAAPVGMPQGPSGAPVGMPQGPSGGPVGMPQGPSGAPQGPVVTGTPPHPGDPHEGWSPPPPPPPQH